ITDINNSLIIKKLRARKNNNALITPTSHRASNILQDDILHLGTQIIYHNSSLHHPPRHPPCCTVQDPAKNAGTHPTSSHATLALWRASASACGTREDDGKAEEDVSPTHHQSHTQNHPQTPCPIQM